MKSLLRLSLSVAFSAVWRIPLEAAAASLTKGYVNATLNDGTVYTLSTSYDVSYGNILSSVAEPSKDPLLVQIDLEGAATRGDAVIETLNSEWSDVYPFIGYVIPERTSLTQGPGLDNIGTIINVPRTTPGAPASQGENSFTALYAIGMSEYPFHASAIWKYNPQNGRLSPSYVAPNGTRIDTFSFVEYGENGNVLFVISGNENLYPGSVFPAVFTFVPLSSSAHA